MGIGCERTPLLAHWPGSLRTVHGQIGQHLVLQQYQDILSGGVLVII